MNPTQKIGFFGFCLALSVGCGILLPYFESNVGYFILPSFVAVIVGILMIALIGWRSRKFGLDPFEPINAVFLSFGVGYVARTLYFSFVNNDTIAGLNSDEYPYLVFALLLILVGVLAFHYGYLIPLGAQMGQRIPILGERINHRRLNFVVILYLIIGSICFYTLLSQSGGLSGDWTTLSRKRAPTIEYLRVGSYLIFAATALRFSGSIKNGKIWIHIPLVLYASLVPLLTSSRSNLFLWLFVLLIVYHYVRGRVSISKFVVVIPVLLTIYSLMLGLRVSSHGKVEQLDAYINLWQIAESIVDSHDFADINTVALIVRFIPNDYPLQYGRTLAALITRPIPRVLWDDKPVNIGGFISQKLYGRPDSYGIIPPSLIGQLYWDFHIPGVIAGMFLFGVICRTAYEVVQRQSKNVYVALLYGIFIFSIFKIVNFDINIGMTEFFTWMLAIGLPMFYIHGFPHNASYTTRTMRYTRLNRHNKNLIPSSG